MFSTVTCCVASDTVGYCRRCCHGLICEVEFAKGASNLGTVVLLVLALGEFGGVCVVPREISNGPNACKIYHMYKNFYISYRGVTSTLMKNNIGQNRTYFYS